MHPSLGNRKEEIRKQLAAGRNFFRFVDVLELRTSYLVPNKEEADDRATDLCWAGICVVVAAT